MGDAEDRDEGRDDKDEEREEKGEEREENGRHIPQVRVMALGLARRVQRTGLAARMITQLHRAGRARGYVQGELSQVYDENMGMGRILDRMRFPVVRRYAVLARQLDG